MESIFSNEDNKKKAIKYVINIGRNRSIQNSPKADPTHRLKNLLLQIEEEEDIQTFTMKFQIIDFLILILIIIDKLIQLIIIKYHIQDIIISEKK